MPAICLGATLFVAGCATLQAGTVHVRDFGATPNDGEDDTDALRKALAAVEGRSGVTLRFDAGTYNVNTQPNDSPWVLRVSDGDGLVLQGTVDAEGRPATTLEGNPGEMANDLDAAVLLRVENCRGFTLRNLEFDNNPPFTTAGLVTAVDSRNDMVEVEVFAGLPHYPAMACYSANVWDLETRMLRPVAAATIGANPKRFRHTWQPVPGVPARRYRIERMGFSERVREGDGLSWHFKVAGRGGHISAADCRDLRIENVRVSNTAVIPFGARFTEGLTLRRFVVKPRPPQLAVGARDAIHTICMDGEFLMEDSTISGVRWDPLNLKSKFCQVLNVIPPRRLVCRTVRSTVLRDDYTGDRLTLWVRPVPLDLDIATCTWRNEIVSGDGGDTYRVFSVDLARDLPETARPGCYVTPHRWLYDRAVLRRNVIENNCGRGLLYQGANLDVYDNVFRNNTYADIALGPVNIGEGPFVRKAVIRNNRFIGSTWDTTTSGIDHNGSIKIYQYCKPAFTDEPFNTDILIANNVFEGIDHGPAVSAIAIANAQRVRLQGNRFVDCPSTVHLDQTSTCDIIMDDR
jgi:hypothetical protein